MDERKIRPGVPRIRSGVEQRLLSCCRRDCVYYLGRRLSQEVRLGPRLPRRKWRFQFSEAEQSAHVNRGSLLLRMELRSNPEILCVVRNALGQLAQTLGFLEPECRAVVLAVDEALTNIIRHAYRGEAERPIEATFRRIRAPQDGENRDALRSVLEDRGVTVDPKRLCGRALEDVRPGGLGLVLYFIFQSMNTLE